MLDYKLTDMEKVQRLNDETIHPDDSLKSISARRMAVGKDIFGTFVQDVKIDVGFFVTWGCNVFIGDQVYINRGLASYPRDKQSGPVSSDLGFPLVFPSTIMPWSRSGTGHSLDLTSPSAPAPTPSTCERGRRSAARRTSSP